MVHAPVMMMEHGTTLTTERSVNPDSDFFKAIPNYTRSFEEAVAYAPNQVYIGNLKPSDLDSAASPWYQNPVEGNKDGRFGEIMEENEFYGLLKICDRFDLVELSPEFASRMKDRLSSKNMFSVQQLSLLDKCNDLTEIKALIESHKAVALYENSAVVGCVREAHQLDPNLTAHVIFENMVSKASGVLAVKNLIIKNNINPADIDYIFDTSEEAIGDMNQRGGGNLAKAIGEVAGCLNATGVDIRGFCAGPAHGLVNAAGLVQSGICKNVVVMAGGCTAKLGMNSRDHIKKEMPVLEDMLAGYAILISQNDGVSPVIRTDIIGRHKISSGSSPQAVIQSIIVDPLIEAGYKISDIDVFSPELQNPEITVPAGAGDVPLANYKMIGAMAVKRGEIEKKDLLKFAKEHGITGFAPTQGHIPSGVPIVGHVLDAMQAGTMQKTMLVGKGSLFLGRMTDLFDGISLIIEKNSGEAVSAGESTYDEEFKQEIREVIADAIQQAADSLAGR